jgi:hypothetical protein
MKPLIILIAALTMGLSALAQYADPNIPKPTSGYGTDGTHTIGVIKFTNPYYLLKDIEIYYPSDVTGKVPTIFYSHAYGGNVSENIIGMLNFVAQKGYAIVYVPYQTTNVTVDERYVNLLNGFRKAARTYTNIIDTTRVGFMGHSFGGGASFGLAYKCITETHWGENGRFIYALAQWYSYNISQSELEAFPANTKLLTEIFNDDTTNDHRMAIDVFNNISIPNADKDFILLRSDAINGYNYVADHNVPNTASAFDAYDYYAYYRFIDALCDYTFNNNADAKTVALGNGSTAQTTMPGGLKSLIETDSPVAVYPETKYTFACGNDLNPRLDHCSATSTNITKMVYDDVLAIAPNPAKSTITVTPLFCTANNEVRIYNASGLTVFSHRFGNPSAISINISNFPQGVYLLTLDGKQAKFIKK